MRREVSSVHTRFLALGPRARRDLFFFLLVSLREKLAVIMLPPYLSIHLSSRSLCARSWGLPCLCLRFLAHSFVALDVQKVGRVLHKQYKPLYELSVRAELQE